MPNIQVALATLFVLGFATTTAASDCTSLIQYGLRDEITTNSNSSSYAQSIQQLCQDHQRFESDKRSGHLSGHYGIAGGSGGFSAERYEALSDALCTNDQSLATLNGQSSLTSRLLNPTALQALQQCESLNALGLKITTDIPDAAEAVSISFYYSAVGGSASQIVVGAPIVDNGLSCTGPSPKLENDLLPNNRAVTYTCKRALATKPFIFLNRQLYAKAATITIPTNAGAITRHVPAVYAEPPPPSELEKSVAVISHSTAPVGSIVQSILAPDEISKVDPEFSKFWTLADGSLAPRDSKFFSSRTDGSLNNVQLPDLRGVFLRGLDAFVINKIRSDEFADPDASRAVGSFQADGIRAHAHASSTPGPLKHIDYEGGGGRNEWGVVDGKKEPTAAFGIAETRPKNAAVYVYIRIN